MKNRLILLLIAAAAAAPAAAQQAPWDNDQSAGDTVAPITSYPLGRADLVATGLVQSLRLARVKEDLCLKYGCLVIVNESRAYKVVEMRVEMTDRRGAKRWGPNQLDRPLLAREATLRIKVPDLATCELPVRFTLRETRGREQLSIDDRVRLCAEPDRHTLMRIKVVKPRVETVDEH
ncbi:MAG TPA: hypothetical protein VFO42_09755 [Sphingomicrobium sp.]|nr:hypothetical protein [Sphingomicrobium sp.]